jgi:hypothetical protein
MRRSSRAVSGRKRVVGLYCVVWDHRVVAGEAVQDPEPFRVQRLPLTADEPRRLQVRHIANRTIDVRNRRL